MKLTAIVTSHGSVKNASGTGTGNAGTLLLSVVAALLVLAGCSGEQGQTRKGQESDLPPLGPEEISGEALWERITEESDYRNYPFWPEHAGMQPGQAPHGPYHRIFINSTLRSALPAQERTVPDGGLIVKENYTSDEQLNSLTVMAKVKGYAPESGNWFWAKYSPEGSIQAQGTPPPCISCHAGKQDNDYVIVRPLDKPVEE